MEGLQNFGEFDRVIGEISKVLKNGNMMTFIQILTKFLTYCKFLFKNGSILAI